MGEGGERPLSFREQNAKRGPRRGRGRPTKAEQEARARGVEVVTEEGEIPVQAVQGVEPVVEGASGAAGVAVDLKGAVAWVARNFDRVVGADERGQAVIVWEQAVEAPPSDVARAYMKVAAQKPIEFFTRVVPKFLGEADAEVSEGEKRDRFTYAQMRKILGAMTKTAARQERPAAIPQLGPLDMMSTLKRPGRPRKKKEQQDGGDKEEAAADQHQDE